MHTETMHHHLSRDKLAEVEVKEQQQTAAYFDLVVLEIKKLENEIADNFNLAETEIKYINDWVLNQNFYKQEKIDLLKLKLESFIRCEGKKIICLHMAH